MLAGMDIFGRVLEVETSEEGAGGTGRIGGGCGCCVLLNRAAAVRLRLDWKDGITVDSLRIWEWVVVGMGERGEDAVKIWLNSWVYQVPTSSVSVT